MESVSERSPSALPLPPPLSFPHAAVNRSKSNPNANQPNVLNALPFINENHPLCNNMFSCKTKHRHRDNACVYVISMANHTNLEVHDVIFNIHVRLCSP